MRLAGGLVGRVGDDTVAVLAVRGEHAVVSGEMGAGAWNESGEAGDAQSAGLPICTAGGCPEGVRHTDVPHEFDGVEHDMGGAVPEGVLESIHDLGVSKSSRLCLEFLVLNAARSGEALGAAWDEINVAGREWRIPPERMKTGVAHAVPLADAALRTLDAARDLGGERFVFPSPVRRGGPLGESSLLHILRKADLAARTTVHGFRSSFRSWAGECTDADHAVMELCLAHTVGNAVERAYARSDLMDKRRALMGAWAEAIGAA